MVFIFLNLIIYSLAPLRSTKSCHLIVKESYNSFVLLAKDNKAYKIPSKQFREEGYIERDLKTLFDNEYLFYHHLSSIVLQHPTIIPQFYGKISFNELIEMFGPLPHLCLDQLAIGICGIIIEQCSGIEYHSFLKKHLSTLTPQQFLTHTLQAIDFLSFLLDDGIIPGDFKSKNLFFNEKTQNFEQIIDHANSIIRALDTRRNRPVYHPPILFMYEVLYRILIQIPTQQKRSGKSYLHYHIWINHLNSSEYERPSFPSSLISLWEASYRDLCHHAPSDEWRKICDALNLIYNHIDCFELATQLDFSAYIENCQKLNYSLKIALTILQNDLQNQSNNFQKLSLEELTSSTSPLYSYSLRQQGRNIKKLLLSKENFEKQLNLGIIKISPFNQTHFSIDELTKQHKKKTVGFESESNLFVLYQGRTIYGTAFIMKINNDFHELANLEITTEFQNKGLGSFFLSHLLYHLLYQRGIKLIYIADFSTSTRPGYQGSLFYLSANKYFKVVMKFQMDFYITCYSLKELNQRLISSSDWRKKLQNAVLYQEQVKQNKSKKGNNSLTFKNTQIPHPVCLFFNTPLLFCT